MSSVFNMVGGGSGGAGGILVVNAVAGATVRAVNEELGEIKTRIADADGIATFKGLASGTWKLTMTLGEQTSSAVEVKIVADYTQTLAFFKAYINATYPSGSVCTCTDGTTTLTAPDTSGSVTFTLPTAGTWTVTATDGNQTASETVEITAEGQNVSVELSFTRYLIKNGQPQVEFSTTGQKWNSHIAVVNAFDTAAYDATTERFVLTLIGASGKWTSNTYQTVDPIDTSIYSKLCIIYESETTADDNGVSFFANEGTAPTYSEHSTATLDYAAPHELAKESFEIPSSADVSIGVTLRVITGKVTAKIKDMWIE